MNKFAKNLFSTGLVTIIGQILTFVIVMYLSRVLTVDEVGMVNYAQSILLYFTMITLFGFQTWGIKEISNNKKNTNEIVGNITFIRVIMAIVCFVGCILVAKIESLQRGSGFTTFLSIYGISVFLTAFNFNFYFAGIYDMQYNAVYNLIRNLIPFMLTIAFVKSSSQLILVPVFYILGLFIAVMYQIIIYFKQGNKISLNKSNIKSTFVIGIPFLLSGILSTINCNVDSLMIGKIMGDFQLGLYSAGYKVIFFLTSIIAIIFTPIFPLLGQLYINDKNALKTLLDNASKVLVMIAMPVMIGGILLSKEILVLFMGRKEYAAGSTSFIILLVYIFVLFMRELYAYSLNAWNYEKAYLKIIMVSATMNFIFNFILIPIYGINAAAMVTLGSELITFYAMRIIFKKEVEHSYTKHVAKCLIPTIAMGVVVYTLKYIGVYVILNISISAIVYLSLIFITKYISKEDIKSILKKV